MKPTTLTIFELFEKDRRYVVPLFQRPYVWSQERQWATLWEDITTKADELLYAGNAQAGSWKHFLGAAVLSQIPTFGRQVAAEEIIDGQQRLTTIQIILVALRDIVVSQNDRGAQRTLDRLTVNDCNMEQDIEAFKVWPTTSDRKDFQAVLNAKSSEALEALYPLKRIPRTQRFFPRPRLVEAYLYFSRAMRDYLAETATDDPDQFTTHNSSTPPLEALTNAITKYMELVVIELEAQDDPQVIFETLNARGEPLLPSDLIRNFVFMEASRRGESVDELYHQYWKDYDEDSSQFWKEEERQGRLRRPRLDLFMFHFLVYKTGNEFLISQLFQEFKSWWLRVSREESVEGILREIQAYSQLYRRFFDAQTNSRLGLFVRRLHVLDTSTVYPLLLYLYGDEASVVQADREQIIADLESYLIRRMVCQLTTKGYNRIFLTMLRNFQRAERVDTQTVRQSLAGLTGDSARWPDDQEFERCWLTYPSYRLLAQRRTAMLLTALDLQLETNKQELMHIDGPLSIEHIRPQNPRSENDWPPLPNPDVVHTLGNLTLLTQQLNSSVSNGPFSQKRPAIAQQSRLRMNAYFQQFSDQDTWDSEKILDRSRKLFDIGLKVWPAPAKALMSPIAATPVEPPVSIVDDYISEDERIVQDFEPIYERLKSAARAETTVRYAEIAHMAGLTTDTQPERNELGRILGSISQQEHSQGRPLLSVVVVSATDGVASRGFFNLARDLGLLSSTGEMDELTFFANELKATFAYWRAH